MTSNFVPDSGPFTVRANSVSDTVQFDETDGLNTQLMILRISKNVGGRSVSDSRDPTIFLSAGGGAATQITLSPIGIPNPTGTKVARAFMTTEARDVYRVEIDMRQPGNSWGMNIHNSDGAERTFTCVVANSDDESRRPWMRVPSSVRFTSSSSDEQSIGIVRIDNLGTGPLTVFLPKPPDGFQIISTLTDDLQPNDTAEVAIAGPGAANFPQSPAPVYTISGTDTLHKAIVTLLPPPHTNSRDGNGNGNGLPPIETRCHQCDVCMGYERPHFGDRCLTPGCGHPHSSHQIPL